MVLHSRSACMNPYYLKLHAMNKLCTWDIPCGGLNTFLPLPTLCQLLFFDAENHGLTAFHTKFSKSTHLVLRRIRQKTILLVMASKEHYSKMLCSVQISCGTYWENVNESA